MPVEDLKAAFTGDYNDLTNKPTIGDGTLTIKDGNGVTVDTFTANQTGDTTVTLPSTDYDDLTNKPTIGDATITLKAKRHYSRLVHNKPSR